MAYDEHLAERVRTALGNEKNLEEKKMMGGLTFMVNEKMCVGVLKDELMCRINPEFHEEAIKRKGCRTMDFTKKPMKGFVFVNPEGTKTKKDFDYWIKLSLEYNTQAKSSKKKK